MREPISLSRFPRTKLILDVRYATELILQVVNSFALLDHLMLVIIRLICYVLEKFINTLLRDSRGLHIINGFARLYPVRYYLAFFYLPTTLLIVTLLFVAA